MKSAPAVTSSSAVTNEFMTRGTSPGAAAATARCASISLEALSRGTDMTPNEAWADAVAAMGPARARMFSSDADVEPVPGLGFGLGVVD